LERARVAVTAFVLYWLLLKATLLSFSGFGSLPQLREDLVVNRAVITDEQLNRAVLVARTTPGPMGVYVVSVGYEAKGLSGAAAGWLAMATPALLVIPLLHAFARIAGHPRALGAIHGLILASAVLVLLSSWPLALDFLRSIQRLTA
jgi:chromate transporter